jgi:bisphosphoglycerate-independent phosphoglycerate mutase (AlkP superfamily)
MFTPDWIQQGYTLLVTADHGMTPDQTHGGTLASVRQVPLYVLGSEQNSFHLKTHVSQCQIAPTICQWLGVEIPSSMQHPSLLGSLVDT